MATPKTGRARRSIPSEHVEQVALFRWWNLQYAKSELLPLLFAIPNGGARNLATGALLKAEGVRRGVPDLCLALPRGPYAGLWIEMKRQAKSHLSQAQSDMLKLLSSSGYAATVCRGFEEAKAVIERYLDGERIA